MNDQDRYHHEVTAQQEREEIEADDEYNAWLDRINSQLREVANEQQRKPDKAA